MSGSGGAGCHSSNCWKISFNVNNIAILFTEEAIQNKKLAADLMEKEREGRLWLAERLQNAGYRTLALEGNYILFFPKKESGAVVEALKEKNVWVRDYGRGILKGWIRVSTGARDYMEKFWEVLLQADSFETSSIKIS